MCLAASALFDFSKGHNRILLSKESSHFSEYCSVQKSALSNITQLPTAPLRLAPNSMLCPQAMLSPSGIPLVGITDDLKYVENKIHKAILIWERAWVEGINQQQELLVNCKGSGENA